jgi:hypothetical protein
MSRGRLIAAVAFLLGAGASGAQELTTKPTLVAEFRGLSLSLDGLFFTRDGKSLIAWSGDVKVHGWPIPEPDGPEPVVRKADAASLIFGNNASDYASFVAEIGENGTLLVADTMRRPSSSWHTRLRLFDLATRRERTRAEDAVRIDRLVRGVSPDGRWLLTTRQVAEEQQELELWECATGRRIGSFEGVLPNHASAPVFSPDGRMAAVAHDNEVVLWDVPSRKVQRVLAPVSMHTGGPRAALGLPEAVAFSPDSRQIAAACYGNGTIQIWDVAEGEQVRRINLRSYGMPSIVVYSSEGSHLAFGGGPWNYVWDIKELDCAAQLELIGVTHLALSPSGKHLAVFTEDGQKSIRLFQLPKKP